MKRLLGSALSALTLAAALAACTAGSARRPAADATTASGNPTAEGTASSVTGDLGGREIVVGTDASLTPFVFTDDAGKIVGLDPDIIAAICEIAHCKPRFVTTDWDGIFAALGAGEFDALMSAIAILPEREAEGSAHFTLPYLSIGQVILVRSDHSSVTGVGSLSKAVVGVQTGSAGDMAAATLAAVPEDRMRRFDTLPPAIKVLEKGDLDALVLDSHAAEQAARDSVEKAPKDGTAPVLKVVGGPISHEDYGILVPDTSPELKVAFDAAIEQLKDKGRLQPIVDRWLKGLEAGDA